MICVVLAALLQSAQSREPVPDVASQRQRESLIKDIYKLEYSRKTPEARIALSKALLKQAEESKDDVAARFVLLREARDLAAEGGDLDTCVSALKALATGFQLSPAALKAEAFSALSKTLKSPHDQARLAECLFQAVDEALAADEIDLAVPLAASASAAARKAKDLPLVGKADALVRRVAVLKQQRQDVLAANERLATTPDDPAAHAVLGRHLCVVAGDWENGLRHLSRGSDSPLKELAKKDLSNPLEASEQVAIGDGWWDLSEGETGRNQDTLRRRARLWYRRAAPRLTGLTRAKVDQRIASELPRWLSADLFAHWTFDEGGGKTAGDASPHKRDGTLSAASWTDGKIGGGLAFDGFAASVIVDAGELRPPWSACLWVLRQEPAKAVTCLIDPASTKSRATGLRLTQFRAPDKVGITQYGWIDHGYDYTVPLNTWTHLAWVCGEASVTLYADGASKGAFEKAIPLHVDTLGSRGTNSLRGKLDDVRIYSRALTAKEVLELFNLGTTP